MEKGKYLFSLIIPVYNVAPYIERCVNSIRQQSFSDFEILLINDGSTDESGEICDHFAEIDPRVRVFHQGNQGVAVARNRGLDEAKGDWIWFVDSDDYIAENALTILHEIISPKSCDTVFFDFLNEWNGVLERDNTTEGGEIMDRPKEEFLCKVFGYANPAILFRNDIFQNNNIRFTPGIRMGEDLEIQYKYLAFCQAPIKINRRLYVYSHRENSAMLNPDTQRNNLTDCLAVARNLQHFVKNKEIVYYNWLCIRVRQIIKSAMLSASQIKDLDGRWLKTNMKDVIERYKEVGYMDVADSTIKLALLSPRLYFLALSIYLTIKRYKERFR